LVPADTNPPVISNVYPDGSSFFQFTNKLSFVASASAGIGTNSIVVALDGVNVSGLSFSGSPTSWNVSCPLPVNTITRGHHGDGQQWCRTTATVSLTTSNRWIINSRRKIMIIQQRVSGLFFDNPQVNAYAGLPSKSGVDNYQFDLNANAFNYRSNSAQNPAPSTTPAGDGQRPQFVLGTTDYNIGFLAVVRGSIIRGTTRRNLQCLGTVCRRGVSYESHAVATNEWLWHRQPDDKFLGTFFIQPTGGSSTWNWAPLERTMEIWSRSGLMTRFARCNWQARRWVASRNQCEFLMLVPTDPVTLTVVRAVNVGHDERAIVYSTRSKPPARPTLQLCFTNGLAVTRASLSADNLSVILTTAPLTFGGNYSIIINSIRDRLNLPNTMPPTRP